MSDTPNFAPVDYDRFSQQFLGARQQNDKIRDYTDDEVPQGLKSHYLSDDGKSGYTISGDGELGHVFSLEKGRGDHIVSHAVKSGARSLNAFDGYLPKLYSRHGFREDRREANWTPGGPDVVFMSRPTPRSSEFHQGRGA